ncbi:MAG: DNA recombination protein RmuC [Blautia sp.]|nr:DNA recombination protein RmuC [Lachnoclostridium sp.]MCM1212830.1 DNA recombination protein RmuC [Blautia sp.]
MGLPEILGIIIVILLLIVLILQVTGRRKSDIGEVVTLLKHTADEQRDSVQKQIASGTTEQFERFGVIQKSIQDTLSTNRNEVNKQLAEFQRQMEAQLRAVQDAGIMSNERVGTTVKDALQTSREEQNKQLHTFGEQVDNRLSSIQRDYAENVEKVSNTLESRMKALQESNEKRLEQMQGVVDEKLQKTLETRLAQSFELVSKQLESVGQGLGEMKALAADARSLKNALTNVKERGTYGEVRLEKLLSDILAPNQYEMNVEIADGKRVEFVVKLPGNGDVPLFLPIDSKFPIEDYNRLLDAEDKQAIDEARRSLTIKIRTFAKEIHDKYIVPPKTTDFALMFLPTEGLYAEVVQNVALFEELRDKYKITAVGATTLSAFLASLQMGFKTLAIEQRSQEVWDTLRAVKSEFNKFGDILDKAHKQIQTADKTLAEIVGRRTRAINRTLQDVEELTDTTTPLIMALEESADE